MTIRGVALDMDGLLFDTEGLYFRVGQEVLGARGHQFTSALQHRMMGRVGLDAIAQMVDMHGLEDSPESLLAESDEIYARLLQEGIPAMPGLSRWMGHLQSSGLPHGVATSSRRRFVDVILPTTDWQGALSFVLCGDDVKHGKPHPEIYLRAAEQLGVAPESMLVLEDSGNGVAAAVAAGAIVVAIPNSHTADHCFDGVALVADSLNDPRLHAMLKAG
ncbi:MAG: HAD-IA family hydrolase [Planctomycetota bacterium]